MAWMIRRIGSIAREVLYTPEQWAALRGAAAKEAG
jgi:hypothetical protein